MPLFRCSACGCVENTALSGYWRRGDAPPLCSECDPTTGRWHGLFEKKLADGLEADERGFLWPPKTALETAPVLPEREAPGQAVNGVVVHLDPPDIAMAEKLAKLVEASGITQRKANYTQLVTDRRYEIGYLGEIAVAKWLGQNARDYRHKINTSGKSQRTDFVVTRQGKKQSLEVKTARAGHYRYFTVNPLIRRYYDVFVGCRLVSAADVEIMGWIGGKVLFEIPITKPEGFATAVRMCNFTQLRPLSELLSLIDEKKTKCSKRSAADTALKTSPL